LRARLRLRAWLRIGRCRLRSRRPGEIFNDEPAVNDGRDEDPLVEDDPLLLIGHGLDGELITTGGAELELAR